MSGAVQPQERFVFVGVLLHNPATLPPLPADESLKLMALPSLKCAAHEGMPAVVVLQDWRESDSESVRRALERVPRTDAGITGGPRVIERMIVDGRLTAIIERLWPGATWRRAPLCDDAVALVADGDTMRPVAVIAGHFATTAPGGVG